MVNALTNRSRPPARWIEVIAIILSGTLLYLYLFGAHTLNPVNTSWMLHGDPAQHYLGWQFFRSEPWHWPPGRIQNFGLPEGTSIVFTDAIPLLALFFKPLSAFLPPEFQYFGPWMLACYILNGLFGLRLIARFTEDRSLRLAAACFFIVSPPLLLRGYGHESLMAQWLVLAGIEANLNGWSGWKWLTLSAVAALCHPYLLIMVLGLACAGACTAHWIDRSHSPGKLLYQAIGISTTLGATMALIGYFSGTGQLAAEGYGFYSMNILALIDPLLGWSRFIQQRPIHPDFAVLGNFGQYEGFLYLGAGMIVLGCIALALTLADSQAIDGAPHLHSRKWHAHQWRPLIAVASLFWILALSNKIMFSNIHLMTVPLPDIVYRALSVFRASGRFGWIAFYLINLLILITVVRRLPARSAVLILLAALALQIADQSAKYKEFRQFIRQRTTWQTPLKSPQWVKLAADAKQLIIIPPHPPMQDIYLPFAHLAAHQHLGTNAAYLARASGDETDAYGKKAAKQLAADHYDPDTLYVFPQPDSLSQVPARFLPKLLVLDGYTVLPPRLAN